MVREMAKGFRLCLPLMTFLGNSDKLQQGGDQPGRTLPNTHPAGTVFKVAQDNFPSERQVTQKQILHGVPEPLVLGDERHFVVQLERSVIEIDRSDRHPDPVGPNRLQGTCRRGRG